MNNKDKIKALAEIIYDRPYASIPVSFPDIIEEGYFTACINYETKEVALVSPNTSLDGYHEAIDIFPTSYNDGYDDEEEHIMTDIDSELGWYLAQLIVKETESL